MVFRKAFSVRLASDYSGAGTRATGLACLLGVLLAGGGSVHAGTIAFFEATSATSNAGGGNSATIAYNTNTGATTSNVFGVETTSGTANVMGLTASSDQSTATNAGTGTLATSFAAGNLSAGTIKAMDTGNTIGGQGSSVVEQFDTLTFTVHGSGVNSSTITDIGFNAGLSGSDPDVAGFTNLFDFALVVGQGAQGSADAELQYSSPNPPNSPTFTQLGWVSESASAPSLSSFAFQGILSGQGATFTDTIDLKFQLACSGETCDYSHTGIVSLALPSNVTYTSASGVFLTAPTPEPATWMTIAIGLMLVGGFRYLRQPTV
jgi:hypothetical protein